MRLQKCHGGLCCVSFVVFHAPTGTDKSSIFIFPFVPTLAFCFSLCDFFGFGFAIYGEEMALVSLSYFVSIIFCIHPTCIPQ